MARNFVTQLGMLRVAALEALPLSREKLRHCLIAAGLREVIAGQATIEIASELRRALPAEITVSLDEQHGYLLLAPPEITGRYQRIQLPAMVDAYMVENIKNILNRLTREELFLDLERQVKKRTAELALESERSEKLLRNMLPQQIAERMKDGETIADSHEASVLFADISDFTILAKGRGAEEVVSLLDQVFRKFDDIAQRHALEKIKTIGDCYMAAAGLPVAQADHVDRTILAGLDIIEAMRELRDELDIAIDVRVGVHTGPLVAGVIGSKKYSYDVWGDTVNVASRMESHGVTGHLHVSHDVRVLLGKRFRVEDRGTIDIKNRGSMRTWLVHGISELTSD
jgi:class 3 adenylate cyclase